jgi:hypothetical protein
MTGLETYQHQEYSVYPRAQRASRHTSGHLDTCHETSQRAIFFTPTISGVDQSVSETCSENEAPAINDNHWKQSDSRASKPNDELWAQ